MSKYFSPVILLFVPFLALAQPKIQLDTFAAGFTRPLGITHCGDSRLFVVEQAGKIWVLDSLGNRLPQPFLDIHTIVNSGGNELGLLGLAFHPNYLQNGYFFVYYITKSSSTGTTRVARYSRDSVDINRADPNSEFVVIEQPQPYPNHKGGCIKFSPIDGYLYIGLGDGGSQGDPNGNGQNKQTYLAKILRIDVNDPMVPYIVPPDNPFKDSIDYKPEIWDLGLRNPWRFSFDRQTGDLWIGDVGQSAREEVDFELPGQGGRNYGWRCYEGNLPYSTAGCPGISNFTFPVFDYPNPSVGCSVIGGYVYRGSQYPGLYGKYIHTDYCSGRWWVTTRHTGNTFTTAQIADLTNNEFTCLGEDKSGELYVTGIVSGRIYRIRELCNLFQVTGMSTPAVCDSSFSGTIFLTVSGGTAPVSYQWSNGSSDQNIVYLNPGTYRLTATDAHGCIQRDTFTIASSSLPVPVVLGPTILCPGDTAKLSAFGIPAGALVQWYKDGLMIAGATGQQWTTDIPGKYQVGFYNDCGFTLSNGFVLDWEVSIPVDIGKSGDTLFVIAGVAFQWYLNGAPISGANKSYYVPLESGNYYCKVVSPAGCTYKSAGVDVIVLHTDTPGSVLTFTLAPNPARNTILLTMALDKPEHFELSMTDVQDRVIFRQTHDAQTLSKLLELNGLPAGTYLLHIRLEEGSFVRKIVKQ